MKPAKHHGGDDCGVEVWWEREREKKKKMRERKRKKRKKICDTLSGTK